ncbi:MAG: LCCL domain-containing protein [Gemmataceae bacterium]
MFGDSDLPYHDDEPQDQLPHGQIPEAQRILQGLLSELPDEARSLVDRIERDMRKLREQSDSEIGRIREQAAQQIAEIENRVESRRSMLCQHAVEQLEPLQKELFRAGELGKALATFVQMQSLKARAQNVMPDPGNLLQYATIGKSHLFRITGCPEGPVWGTDIYTADSRLASAAVHAGAIEAGEEAVVRVTLEDMSNQRVFGTMRHGVMSMDWGPYHIGYRVARS